MFDTYMPAINTSPAYITVNKVERCAPTDESVRLLREMEAEAQNKVLKAVRVENTLVDGVLHKMDDYLSDCTNFACIFKVNGKQMRSDFVARGNLSREQIAEGIRDAIAKQIANVIAASVLQSAFRL